jgi:tetratricopeptide (TPR) repeat protein
MASIVTGLLAAFIATNLLSAADHTAREKTGAKTELTATNDLVEQEYVRLLLADQSADEETDRWMLENDRLAAAGAGDSAVTLRLRMKQRFEPVEKAYREFLQRNPKHVKGHLAFGSFLNDLGREDEAAAHYLVARDLDPKNPAAWNNLAIYYGHNSPVTNAFLCYEKAIELDPSEPNYYQDFATTVYLFRRDATNHYRITEQQVFDKSLALYQRALTLSSNDFKVATDLAQTYYGINPPRVRDALQAWEETLKLAANDVERQGVRLHLARWHRTAGDADAARRELNQVTDPTFTTMKGNILRSLEKKFPGTNAAPQTPRP